MGSHYSMSDTFTLTCISNSFGGLFLGVVMATISTAISTPRAQDCSLILGCFSSNKAINTLACLYWKLEQPVLPFQTLSVHFPSALKVLLFLFWWFTSVNDFLLLPNVTYLDLKPQFSPHILFPYWITLSSSSMKEHTFISGHLGLLP